MIKLLRWVVLFGVLGCFGQVGLVLAESQVDIRHFDSPQQRQRYNNLIDEFRCPKCLNTNISGSDAPIAKDLRRVVHRLVVLEGQSDQQVRDYLQARYGDFVLYNTPFNERTWLIWVLPVVIVGIGVAVIVGLLRRARSFGPTSLSDTQDQQVKSILGEHDKPSLHLRMQQQLSICGTGPRRAKTAPSTPTLKSCARAAISHLNLFNP